MDIRKSSAVERLKIVEAGRRRRWSEAEKLWIVMENQSAPRWVSLTARRHWTSRSQLETWLRSFRAERHAAQREPAFVPAVIAPVPTSEAAAAEDGAAIVVDVPQGVRMRIAASTPPDLAAVLRALR